jgi:cohesin loading factor subunit SCC2
MYQSAVILSRLRDGRSIRTVSALLLQLVQTSAHDVRIEARKIDKARQNKFALRRQESLSESQPGPQEPFLDENDQGVCANFYYFCS